MREDVVKKIQKSIEEREQWEKTIKQIKIHSLLQGATEEEYDEALRRVSFLNSDKQKQMEQGREKKSSVLKKLVEIDIVAHITTAVIVLFFLVLLVGSYIGTHSKSASESQSSAVAVSTASSQGSSLIQQVFANRLPINSQQVFSYPASGVSLSLSGIPKKEVFGFFPYWMLSEAENVNFLGVTTVSFFGLEVNGNGDIVTQENGTVDPGWHMWNDPQFDTLNQTLKNRGIKRVLTIKSFTLQNISSLVLSDASQKQCIANIIHLLSSKSLDGVNIDFEATGEVDPSVSEAFTRFITNLHTALEQQLPAATLSVDTYITAAAIPQLIDVQAVSQQVDSLIMMGYDLSTPSGNPGSVSPMGGQSGIIGYVQNFLEKVPSDKLILAVPYYGYDWTTIEKQDAAMLPYAQIATMDQDKTLQWDDSTQTPWFSYKDQQTDSTHKVYFDNIQSLGIKYDFVNEKNLKGIGIWALGYDGLKKDLSALILEKFAN